MAILRMRVGRATMPFWFWLLFVLPFLILFSPIWLLVKFVKLIGNGWRSPSSSQTKGAPTYHEEDIRWDTETGQVLGHPGWRVRTRHGHTYMLEVAEDAL